MSIMKKFVTSSWSKQIRGSLGGTIVKYIQLAELGLNVDKNIQYLKNDSLRFQVFVKTRPEV